MRISACVALASHENISMCCTCFTYPANSKARILPMRVSAAQRETRLILRLSDWHTRIQKHRHSHRHI